MNSWFAKKGSDLIKFIPLQKNEPKIPEASELIRMKNRQERRARCKAELLECLKRPRIIAALLIVIFLLIGFFSILGETQYVQALQNSTAASTLAEAQTSSKVAIETFTKENIARLDCVARSRIPQYTYADILKMDLTKPSHITVSDLSKISQGGLKGQEKYFVQAEQKYGVNCVFLFAIAVLESGWGNYMYADNNMFGFGGIDFASKKECILTVGKALGENYLDPDGPYYHGKTISGVHTRYASSSTWTKKIATIMLNLYQEMRKNNLNALK